MKCEMLVKNLAHFIRVSRFVRTYVLYYYIFVFELSSADDLDKQFGPRSRPLIFGPDQSPNWLTFWWYSYFLFTYWKQSAGKTHGKIIQYAMIWNVQATFECIMWAQRNLLNMTMRVFFYRMREYLQRRSGQIIFGSHKKELLIVAEHNPCFGRIPIG